jgi:hypothetical protein
LCWFYGKELYDKYRVPIGLIPLTWKVAYLQQWSSPQAIAKCKAPSKSMSTLAFDPSVTFSCSARDQPQEGE